jgi:hypothetical protein
LTCRSAFGLTSKQTERQNLVAEVGYRQTAFSLHEGMGDAPPCSSSSGVCCSSSGGSLWRLL